MFRDDTHQSRVVQTPKDLSDGCIVRLNFQLGHAAVRIPFSLAKDLRESIVEDSLDVFRHIAAAKVRMKT